MQITVTNHGAASLFCAIGQGESEQLLYGSPLYYSFIVAERKRFFFFFTKSYVSFMASRDTEWLLF